MTDAVAVVEAFVKAWERNDPDEIISLFDDDCVWYDSVPSEPYRGRATILAMLQRYSRHIADIEIEVLNQAVAGDVVFQERIDRGTRDGKPFAVQAVCVFKVKDGKIIENRDYWNPGGYARKAAE
jgi:limonene-1,2-epoxide hydrolase